MSTFFSSFFSVFTLPVVLSLVGIFVLLGIIAFIKSLNSDESPKAKVELQYRKRPVVLDKREAAFFYELKKQLSEGYNIFPKMRIADFLETTATGRDYYKQRNKILPKHVDFLICDQYFKPLLAIEVNGSSHRQEKVQVNDALKKEIFEAAEIPLKTVTVGTDFVPAVQEIVKII